jgi:TatD DNase family protein
MIDAHNHWHISAIDPFYSPSVPHNSLAFRACTTCAISPDDWPLLHNYTKKHPHSIVAAYGIHPWKANEFQEEKYIAQLEELLASSIDEPLALAIGESGLDANSPNMAAQENLLLKHLDLAGKYALPIVLHCVKAWDSLYRTLQKYPKIKVHLHGFGGNAQQLQQFLQLKNAIYFSFGPRTLRSAKLQEALLACPADKLLLESDYEGVSLTEMNEQWNELVEFIARLSQRTSIDLMELNKQNWQELYINHTKTV